MANAIIEKTLLTLIVSWIENAPYVDNTKMSLVDTNKSKIKDFV